MCACPDLYKSGLTTDITNIDLSPVVISRMSEENKALEDMKYHVMDVRDLTFDDEAFDVRVARRAATGGRAGDNHCDHGPTSGRD